MPRRGRGQQATRVATGQQYGEAQAQEQAQDMIPLPEMEQPGAATMAPGSMAFAGRSQMPNEPVTATGAMPPAPAPVVDPVQKFKVAQYVAVMGELVNQPTSSPFMRNAYRVAKSQMGNVQDFADKGLPPNVKDQ